MSLRAREEDRVPFGPGVSKNSPMPPLPGCGKCGSMLHFEKDHDRLAEDLAKAVKASPKKRPHYLPSHAEVKLCMLCRTLHHWLPEGCVGIFLVGSALERPDFRDVDVRAMLKDETFAETFPGIDPKDPRLNGMWSLVCFTVSDWLSAQTGLPVDFQVQQMTRANELFGGRERNALGHWPFYPGGG